MQTMTRRRIGSPVGPLTLVADGDELVAIEMLDEGSARAAQADGDTSAAPPSQTDRDNGADVLAEAASQLAAYFAGDRRTFDLSLRLEGTPFQLSVWDAVAGIPFGETVSYADIAHQIGRPTALRAVGRTVGLNPLPIVVPCHRVVGSRGQLTGYAGGLAVKERLLALERGAS